MNTCRLITILKQSKTRKMPPKVKKTRKKTEIPQYPVIKEEAMEEEKENNCFNSLTDPNKVQSEEKKVEGVGKLSSQPSFTNRTSEMQVKPAGFWSKKLQDLEENNLKNKRHGLYEFSGTDESESSYKIKKKPRQKTGLKKKRQCVVPRYNKAVAKRKNKNEPEKKVMKLPCKLALGPEQVMLMEEKKELAVEAKNLTFSAAVQSFGITSTPAVNKKNMIAASNFLFLSPINKEEAQYSNSLTQSSPPELKGTDGSPLTVHLNKETPRVETKLKRFSCRRVLRSGRMLNT